MNLLLATLATFIPLTLVGAIAGSPFYTPDEDIEALSKTTPTSDRAGLPRVLLIGDSISIGYTPAVRDRLEGIARVERPDANCGNTAFGLRKLDEWLGETRWDVIHFNWGLHDLAYRHPDAKAYGNRDKINGTISVPLDAYERNLEALVRRLKRTGAALVWASTTKVPEGEAGRFVGDDLKYNAAAKRVMDRHGIPINDLHRVSAALPPSAWTNPGDVHFTQQGSEALAKAVAESIRRVLALEP